MWMRFHPYSVVVVVEDSGHSGGLGCFFEVLGMESARKEGAGLIAGTARLVIGVLTRPGVECPVLQGPSCYITRVLRRHWGWLLSWNQVSGKRAGRLGVWLVSRAQIAQPCVQRACCALASFHLGGHVPHDGVCLTTRPAKSVCLLICSL